jgi:DNA repair photolyase
MVKKNTVYHWSFNEGIRRSEKFEEKGLAGFSINVGTKCNNDCLYCFSGSVLFRHTSFKKYKKDPSGYGYAIVDPNLPQKVAKDAVRHKWGGKRGIIQLCTFSDAWCPAAREHDLGRQCLLSVLENDPDWTIRILTKNHEVENDFDVIKQYKDRVSVGLTITSTPNKAHIMELLEKNASPMKERIRVLKKAKKMGLRTYLMLCPLLPTIADSPEQIDWYVKLAKQINAEEVFCEAVNSRGAAFKHVYQELEKYGYKKESKAIQGISDTKTHAEYTLRLIQNMQGSMQKFYDLNKLRFLLYPNPYILAQKNKIGGKRKGVIWL